MQSIEPEWPVPQRPMELKAIFVAAERLALRTFRRGFTAALLLIAPATMLFGSAVRQLTLAMAEIFEKHPELASAGGGAEVTMQVSMAAFEPAGTAMTMVLLTGLLLIMCSAVAHLAVITDAWEWAVGARATLREWIGRSLGRPLQTTIVQTVLMIVLVMLAGVAAMLIMAMFIGIVDPVLGMFISAVIILFIGVRLMIATIFRTHEIVADDRGPWRSIISSMALVKGDWWRVFRGLLVFGVSMFVLGQIIDQLFPGPRVDPAMLQSEPEDAADFVALYRLMARILTPEYTLTIGVVGALGQFALANLLTAQYVDLRARRGDFEAEEPAGTV